MLGINGGEFIVLLIIAAVVIGPERLPGYAEQLTTLVKSGRRLLADAKRRVDSEFGDELGDVDWSTLDPRRYDPRRIVRDALLEDDGLGLGALIGNQGADAGQGSGAARGAATGADRRGATIGAAAAQFANRDSDPDWTAPFDDEAT